MGSIKYICEIIFVVAIAIVSACGGGSSSSVDSNGAVGGGVDASLPVISVHPDSKSVLEGYAATFTVTASGALAYQWQRSTDSGTSYLNISGAVASEYITPVTTVSDNGQRFRVVVTGSGGEVISNAAILTVTASVAAVPVITTQPVNQSVVTGTSAKFTVSASGALFYQWQISSDGGASYSNISGATSADYMTPITTLLDNGKNYRVVVSGSGGSVTSNTVSLVVSSGSLTTVLFERSYNYGAVSNILSVKDDGSGYTWLTTGTNRNTYAAMTPAKQIIYRHISASLPQDNGLYVMSRDGSNKTPLIANDGTVLYEGQSESGRIIYSRDVPGNSKDIYSVNADGTGVMAISTTVYGDIFKCTVSGDRVIYQNSGLYSAKADGSLSVQLTANIAGRNEQFEGVDGAGRIVFTSYETYYGTGTGGVYRVSPDGGTVSELAIATIPYEFSVAGITRAGRVVLSGTSGTFPNRLIDESGVTLVEVASGGVDYLGSTKFGQVIYRRRADGTAGSSTDIYIIDETGANIALAAELGVDENFDYVSDNGRVIYSTPAGLYAVNTDGTGRSTLALNNNVYVVFKAVLGNQAIYEQTEGGTVTYLYAVNLDGSGTTPLLNSGGSALFSGITPDGKILVRREPASLDLWVVNADGSNPLALANSGENELYLAAFQ